MLNECDILVRDGDKRSDKISEDHYFGSSKKTPKKYIEVDNFLTNSDKTTGNSIRWLSVQNRSTRVPFIAREMIRVNHNPNRRDSVGFGTI